MGFGTKPKITKKEMKKVTGQLKEERKGWLFPRKKKGRCSWVMR
jgi:hypothetical protein